MSNTQPFLSVDSINLTAAALDVSVVPTALKEAVPLDVDFNVQVSPKPVAGEVLVSEIVVTATAKAKGERVFGVKATFLASATVRNLTPAQLEEVGNFVLPNQVIPFARQTIADLAVRTGYPAVLMPFIQLAPEAR